MNGQLRFAAYLLLVLYIALAYGSPPRFLSHVLLGHPVGKFLAFAACVGLALCFDPLMGILAATAVVVTLPHLEFFETNNHDKPDPQHTKPPGKNIQERRSLVTDIESKLRKPKLSEGHPVVPSRH
jgi:hypothetical protein